MTTDSLLIHHARVFTADPARPSAQAVGIQGNRIAFVGSDEEAQHWRTAATHVIDAGQATLTPGLVDSHYHLFLGSTELSHAQLWDAHSLDHMREIIRAYAAAHPDEECVSAVQFRYEILRPGERLTRHHLDDMLPDRPLLVMGYDHHTAWANTRALEIAGALHGAPTGPNSEILMGSDGLASGELVEPAAYAVVLRHFDAWGRTVKGLVGRTAGEPRLNAARDSRSLREGLRLAASYGITSVHNMDGDLEQAEFYARMEAAGELTLRVNVPYSIFPTTTVGDLAEAVVMAQRFSGDKVSSGRVKLFMDGVMESWTAYLLEDYADRPGWRGDTLYSAEHFNWLARECDARGLQITVHAIADAAIRRTLDGYELAQKANGVRDSRHRIEHIECVHPDDLVRFARLGVIASMQPYHSPITFPETHELFPTRVGPQRWPCCFPWQNVRGAGARLAFGSDWPVVTADPMAGMHAALNRRAWGPGVPDQRQSLADTLLSYTCEGAYAEFREAQRGQVKPGMLADLALFSHDLFALPPEDIAQARPVLTVFDGRIVFQA